MYNISIEMIDSVRNINASVSCICSKLFWLLMLSIFMHVGHVTFGVKVNFNRFNVY